MPASRQRRVTLLTSLIAFTLAALVAALPAGALASGSPGQPFDSTGGQSYGAAPPNNSAGDQYVETVPTTKGPRTPGKVRHEKKLAAGLQKKLAQQGGSDSGSLAALAATPDSSSAGDGAGGSSTTSNGGGHNSGTSSEKSPAKGGSDSRHDDKTTAFPSAAINAVDGGEAGLGWLVVAILAITALALGAAVYQRRRDKGSTG
jgi:hypothetical protein